MNAMQWMAGQIAPGFTEWQPVEKRKPTKCDELIEFIRSQGRANSTMVAERFGILQKSAFTRLAYAERNGRIRRIGKSKLGVPLFFELAEK